MKKLTLIVTIFLFCFLDAKEPLIILFEQRALYVIKEHNSLKGLVASPAIKALDEANINYILKEKPSKRHLYEIKANFCEMCALGWFKNKDREEFAKFSLPLYEDKPLGIISLNKNSEIFKNIDIKILLKNRDLKLLTKSSYSYGEFIDKRIEKYRVDKNEVYLDNNQMLNLIDKKRADYMFISKEEASWLISSKNYKNLKFYKIKDIPQGNKRYLICSKKVPKKLLARFNKALRSSR